MSKLSGAVLIVAGIAMAGYALHWSQGSSADAGRPGQVDALATIETPVQKAPPSVQPHSDTPAAPVLPPASGVEPPAAVSPAVGAPLTLPHETAPTLPVVVAQAAPKAALVRPSASVAPAFDRAGLAKELQRQLQRVGCYQGHISGVWTPMARRSMKAFTDQVNAALPVDQPDYILLAMLQGYDGQACGRGCPAGQERARDGRCLPTAVIAAGSKKHKVNKAQAPAKGAPLVAMPAQAIGAPPIAAAGAPSEPASPPSGRMSLAGPNQETAGMVRPPSIAVAPEKREARQDLTQRQRHTGSHRSTDLRRVGVRRPSGPPGWTPWAWPWAMN